MCTVKKQALTKQYLYHSTYGKDRNFNNIFSPAGLQLRSDTLHLKIQFMNKNPCYFYEVNLVLPPQPVYIVMNWLAGVIRTAYNTMPLLIYKV